MRIASAVRPDVPRRRAAGPEESIHRAVVTHLEMRVRPSVVWWHVPNGGKRTPGEAGKMRALGQRAGMPDLMLLDDGQLYCLELKPDRGGRLSPAQTERLDELSSAGARTYVAIGLDDALDALTRWGLLRTRSVQPASTGERR